MLRATNSLPVPLSPVINTEAVEGATISTRRKISCMRLEEPTMAPRKPVSRSLRRVASSSISVPRWRAALAKMFFRRAGSTGFWMKS